MRLMLQTGIAPDLGLSGVLMVMERRKQDCRQKDRQQHSCRYVPFP